MNKKLLPGEWYPGHYADLSAAVDKLRREDPEYDKAWWDGLQRMADEWDQRVLAAVYGTQRTGDEPV